jgi:hypothetical protein
VTKTNKAPVLANRHIKVSREVPDGDGKKINETAEIVPGQEVPAWAVELIKPEHLGDPRDPLEEEDQFLTALRETATREGIPWEDDWRKEHLSQAITAVRQAASAGRSIDMGQFGPAREAVVTEGVSPSGDAAGSEQLKPLDQMSRTELEDEYKERFGDKPHHALIDSNLRARLQEARDKG